MRLSKIFKNVPTVNTEGLTFDSRTVKPGDTYFCLPGLTHDGHDFIDQAVEKGAIAIVHSKVIDHPTGGAVYIRVDDTTNAMNQAARIFYNRPADALRMYGITGTNGKSTIANIIRHLEQPETPCGYIGTIAIAYGNNVFEPDLTTPDAIFLQKTLRNMVDAGMKACAMEVSSHGLAQRRVDAIDYDCAVFTNFTYDHLDFHGTMENYFNAKAKLFSHRVKTGGVSILNADDSTYKDLKQLSQARTISYSIECESDYRAINIKMDQTSIIFDLVYGGKTYPVESNLVGEFNLYNLLASIAAVHETSGQPLESIIAKAKNIPQIAGRMEQIHEGQDFNVICDFAHTPDGMEKMMRFGRMIVKPGGKLIAVFGSAGKRDKAKRKVFGQLAEKYCDSVYLTEDDPRDESPKQIANEIRTGMSAVRNVFVADRYEAIRQAIESANAGDTILILGKGDETFMYHEEGRVPWMGDNNAAKECIQRLLKE
ncbi:MAG: UDP-N-acetylmuramoyl-L-alanyl-D-glutamate--2,6-diaminopimelate ligase [Erysipelotrichaceae bacterium]|nr:UDP-N-acetylmuramoyl-L-alanyl-D-glutamate--2,6-diaminopimelate ligase [Erysipelotrichaceae bacterium]